MSAVMDVYSELLAAELAGWALLRRAMRDDVVSDQLVVVTEAGGGAPSMPAASGIGQTARRTPEVQIRVRGNPWDGDGSTTRAQAIYDHLHGRTDVMLGSGSYLWVQAQTSAPVFIGFDLAHRPEHTITLTLAEAQGVGYTP